jgi:hypothetical protein
VEVMSDELANIIKNLYNPPLSDEKAAAAKDNLVGFFKVLQEADARMRKEEEQKQKEKNQTLNQTKPSL